MLTARIPPALASIFDSIDFPPSGAVVAAVSGGSDSTALLLLLAGHLKALEAPCRVLAVTVDHGLRPESAAEARQVAELCASVGIDHVTKIWTGKKPATGIAAAARQARYRLLVDAAVAAGASMILTGHTADDQAETVLMRSVRGEGRGLAAMAPATLLERRVWLMRPLLDTRRETLRQWLRGERAGWIDDPSNENPASERVRARRAVGSPGAVEELLARAQAAADERTYLGRLAASLIDTCATLPAPGLIRLDPASFDGGSEVGGAGEAALYALRILLAVTGGRAQLPDTQAASALLSRLASRPLRATLSRTVIDAHRDAIWLYREQRGLPVRGPVRPGTVWDGRLFMKASRPGTDVAPLGRAGTADLATGIDGVPGSVLRAALGAQPALWAGRELINVAVAIPIASPWARFLPSFDLAPARAVATLIGAPMPPDPPYRGHSRSEP